MYALVYHALDNYVIPDIRTYILYIYHLTAYTKLCSILDSRYLTIDKIYRFPRALFLDTSNPYFDVCYNCRKDIVDTLITCQYYLYSTVYPRSQRSLQYATVQFCKSCHDKIGYNLGDWSIDIDLFKQHIINSLGLV